MFSFLAGGFAIAIRRQRHMCIPSCSENALETQVCAAASNCSWRKGNPRASLKEE